MESIEISDDQNIVKIKKPDLEEMNQFIIDNTNELYSVLNKNFEHEFINKVAYFNVLGYSEEDVIGKRPRDFTHPDDIPRAVAAIKKGLIQGEILEKFRIKHKDGHYIWVEAKAKLIKQKNGDFKVLFISRDITKSMLIEKSEAKFRTLFENSSYLVFILDSSGKIINLNQTALKHLKYRKEFFIGKNFREIEILDKNNIKKLEKKYKDLILNKNVAPFEFKLETSGLNLNWVKIHANLINFGESQLIQILIEDISKRKKAEVLLKQSEAKFRHLFYKSPYGIMIFDSKGNLISSNSTLIKKFSTLSPEAIEGKNFVDIIKLFNNKDELFSLFMKRYKAIRKGIVEPPMEFKVERKDESILWLFWECSLVELEGINFYQVSIQDITEKKLVVQKLKESEARYRLITENSNDLIRVLNKDFQIEFLNEETHMKVLGYSKEDLINKTDMFFNHPDDFKRINTFMLKVFKDGEGFHESRLRHKDGNYIWFEVKIKCYNNEQGQQKYLLVYRDINERKKAEKKLKKSEEMFRNLYEKSPVGIILTDDKGIILEQNQASEKIFGYHSSELYGKNFQDYDVFNPKQIQLIKNTYSGLLNGNKAKPIELRIKKKDGSIAWINWQLSIIEQDEFTLVETTFHDITEEKKIKLLIEEENEKLLELNKMKNELVSRVSHELKTPLNSVYGGTQILLDLYKKDLTPESLEFVEMIHKGGKRLKKLIESLLDTSRIDSNKLFLDLQEHNLTDIIRECVEDMMYLAGEREIEICLDLLDEVRCEIDRLRIEQVITNLLSNAIKNTPPSGVVKVSLSSQGNNIYVSVEDTGIGLTSDEMNKLFNKFGKIERYGKRMNVDIEGSGLGLFISKEIVDLHHGSIWVESQGKNLGSKFTFKLDKCYVL